jgi:hypothetical protein
LYFIYLTGAEDPRCPIAGLEEPSSRAAKAYGESGSAENFMVAWTFSSYLLLIPLFLIWTQIFYYLVSK